MSCPILRFNPALSLPLDAAPAPLPPVAWEDEEEAFGRRYDEVGEDEVFFFWMKVKQKLVVGSTLYVE